MRIGIDARTVAWNRWGGIGNYTNDLIRHLLEIDRFNSYSLFGPEGPWPEGLAGGNGARRIVPGLIPGNDYHLDRVPSATDEAAEDAAVSSAVEAERLDIYHVPQNGIGLPSRKGCRFILTLMDVIPMVLPHLVHPRYVEDFGRRVPPAVRAADAIVTVSEHSRREIVRTLGVPEEKVHVTPLAAAEIFTPRDKDSCRSLVKARYQVSDRYILHVGGFNARKNVETIVEAFGLARRRLRPRRVLVLVGDPASVRPEVERAIARLGLGDAVVFPGRLPREDMPALYSGADIFVYLSLHEGFGLPPLEAMACGVPTVTSDAASLPEVVAEGALCTDPRDPARLAELMVQILQERSMSRRLAELGLKRSRDFSWRETAGKTLAVYRNL